MHLASHSSHFLFDTINENYFTGLVFYLTTKFACLNNVQNTLYGTSGCLHGTSGWCQ
jgi:hypothetical protein